MRLKKYLTKYSICLLLSVLMQFASACTPTSDYSTERLYALNTIIDITAYGGNADGAISAAKAEARRLETLLSVTVKGSDIARVNSSGSAPVNVSDETLLLVSRSVEISMVTSGLFDPTMYRVLRLWGFTSGEYRVPEDSEISRELSKIGCNNILIENNTLQITSGAELDLGGIAKGYIADKMAEAMINTGCEYGIISLGGNVKVVGHKPSGEAFKVGVKHPENGGYFAVVSINEGSVITSGGYQRFFTENGKTYHHILDPRTGCPSESDADSVTIIGVDGAVCDALSTALYVGGTELADRLYNDQSELSFEYLILGKDQHIYASKGLEGHITLSEGYKDRTIIYK